jgi:hypothetical protein
VRLAAPPLAARDSGCAVVAKREPPLEAQMRRQQPLRRARVAIA